MMTKKEQRKKIVTVYYTMESLSTSMWHVICFENPAYTKRNSIQFIKKIADKGHRAARHVLQVLDGGIGIGAGVIVWLYYPRRNIPDYGNYHRRNTSDPDHSGRNSSDRDYTSDQD